MKEDGRVGEERKKKGGTFSHLFFLQIYHCPCNMLQQCDR